MYTWKWERGLEEIIPHGATLRIKEDRLCENNYTDVLSNAILRME